MGLNPYSNGNKNTNLSKTSDELRSGNRSINQKKSMQTRTFEIASRNADSGSSLDSFIGNDRNNNSNMINDISGDSGDADVDDDEDDDRFDNDKVLEELDLRHEASKTPPSLLPLKLSDAIVEMTPDDDGAAETSRDNCRSCMTCQRWRKKPTEKKEVLQTLNASMNKNANRKTAPNLMSELDLSSFVPLTIYSNKSAKPAKEPVMVEDHSFMAFLGLKKKAVDDKLKDNSMSPLVANNVKSNQNNNAGDGPIQASQMDKSFIPLTRYSKTSTKITKNADVQILKPSLKTDTIINRVYTAQMNRNSDAGDGPEQMPEIVHLRSINETY